MISYEKYLEEHMAHGDKSIEEINYSYYKLLSEKTLGSCIGKTIKEIDRERLSIVFTDGSSILLRGVHPEDVCFATEVFAEPAQ